MGESSSIRRVVLAPRVVVIDDDDVELPKLRRRALAALNLGLPQACEEDCDVVDEASSLPKSAKCSCLRRSGRCTCNDDRAWLQSKRREASIYVPPHARKLASSREGSNTQVSPAETHAKKHPAPTEDEDKSQIADDCGFTCVCLRRSGRCTCSMDSTWLQRKRRCIVPYVPPHVIARQVEVDQLNAKAAAIVAETDVLQPARSDKGSTASGHTAGSVNIRTLARKWNKQLENRGDCRFNPLQMDGNIVLEDIGGLIAECVEHAFSTKGVKALPALQGGQYQFEIELLRDCALMIGWSGAMTLPGQLDFQGYAYSSTGSKCHGQQSAVQYGPPFGKAGDVIGAMLSWELGGTGKETLRLSFALNGRCLGSAFEVGKEDCIPMQPHICQLGKGGMLKVRLRGAAALPLLYPAAGFKPVSEVSDDHFCAFSVAVARATAERVVAGVTLEQLQNFHLPDTQIAELYDIPGETKVTSLTSAIALFLGLDSTGQASMLHVRFLEPGTTSSTALLVCKKAPHMERLLSKGRERLAPQDESEMELPFSLRPLRHATASSKERLREWRGEDYRPQTDCSAARRLIHGCLQSQMPLPHVVEEKNRRSLTKQD